MDSKACCYTHVNGTRDDFSEKTKRVLAERVGWRCSYRGCEAATVGPHTAEQDKSILLGEAAHITAAAPGGPRFDPRLTNEERKHISNGIWMCRMHSRLVDVDEANFSESTLRQWKVLAERSAYEALGRGPMPGCFSEPDTLIALGLRIVIKGVWLSGGCSEWRFRCKSYCRGNLTLLRDEIENRSIDFVVVESQGDGRLVSGPIEWKDVDGLLELKVPISSREPRGDPKRIVNLALSPSGDLCLEGGNLKRVRGVPAAIQGISTALGMMLGEAVMHPKSGSLSALYYHNYSGDLQLLGRMLALEIARLATIPIDGRPPALNTIWRVNKVEVPSLSLDGHRLSVNVDLDWSDGDKWNGVVPIYIHENLEKLPPWAGS